MPRQNSNSSGNDCSQDEYGECQCPQHGHASECCKDSSSWRSAAIEIRLESSHKRALSGVRDRALFMMGLNEQTGNNSNRTKPQHQKESYDDSKGNPPSAMPATTSSGVSIPSIHINSMTYKVATASSSNLSTMEYIHPCRCGYQSETRAAIGRSWIFGCY